MCGLLAVWSQTGLHRAKYDPLHALVSYDQNVPSVCVVFENVVQFPVQVLIDVLGHLYCVSTILVDAVTWMGAVRRKRRYAVFTRRGHAHLRRPLSEFGN